MTPLLLSAERALLDDRLDTPVADGAVLVVDGAIVATGTRNELEPRAGDAERVHHPGATLLPGLVDAHVHLCFDPDRDPTADLDRRSPTGLDDAALLTAMRGRGAGMLGRGITTVRDLGDRDGLGTILRAEWAARPHRGPRLLVAGPPITPPGGHCWFLGGATSDADLEARVDELAGLGVDWIKVMVSGGRITAGGAERWESQYDEAALRRIVAAAARHGLPVAAHAHSTRSARDAVRAGVRTVEHLTLLDDTGDALDVDDALMAEMAAGEVWACPADRHDPVHARVMAGDEADALLARVARLAGHGVRLVAGTDAGVRPFGDVAGALARAGSLLDAPTLLRSATSGAAAALGLDGVTGALRAGLRADALVVAGDPLADLAALHDVVAVVRDGRRVGVDSVTSAGPGPHDA